MIPRIRSVKPMPNYCLDITFDDGKAVVYDVKEDIEQIDDFRDLHEIPDLFGQVQLDQSRTCVFWNDGLTFRAILSTNMGKSKGEQVYPN